MNNLVQNLAMTFRVLLLIQILILSSYANQNTLDERINLVQQNERAVSNITLKELTQKGILEKLLHINYKSLKYLPEGALLPPDLRMKYLKVSKGDILNAPYQFQKDQSFIEMTEKYLDKIKDQKITFLQKAAKAIVKKRFNDSIDKISKFKGDIIEYLVQNPHELLYLPQEFFTEKILLDLYAKKRDFLKFVHPDLHIPNKVIDVIVDSSILPSSIVSVKIADTIYFRNRIKKKKSFSKIEEKEITALQNNMLTNILKKSRRNRYLELENYPIELIMDKEFYRKLFCQTNGKSIIYTPKNFDLDKETVQAIFECQSLDILNFVKIPETFKKNEDFIVQFMRSKPHQIRNIPLRYLEGTNAVQRLLSYSGKYIEYLPEFYMNDPQIIYTAIKNWNNSLFDTKGKRLRLERNYRKEISYYASTALKRDLAFIDTALNLDVRNYEYIPEDMKKDLKIQKIFNKYKDSQREEFVQKFLEKKDGSVKMGTWSQDLGFAKILSTKSPSKTFLLSEKILTKEMIRNALKVSPKGFARLTTEMREKQTLLILALDSCLKISCTIGDFFFKKIPSDFLEDIGIVKRLLQLNPSFYFNLSNETRLNSEIAKDKETYIKLSKKVILKESMDVKYVLRIIRNSKVDEKIFPKELIKDTKYVKSILKRYPILFKSTSEHYSNNKEMVELVIKSWSKFKSSFAFNDFFRRGYILNAQISKSPLDSVSNKLLKNDKLIMSALDAEAFSLVDTPTSFKTRNDLSSYSKLCLRRPQVHLYSKKGCQI